ncbi:MAG: hypothetical protein R6U97_04125 [Desulfosalsimonas sp.]
MRYDGATALRRTVSQTGGAYSSIVKEESSFNDSEMFVVGSAWARGGWYIYTDLAYSNGNDFVGKDDVDPYNSLFGENPNDDWKYRFNINFGYYF